MIFDQAEFNIRCEWGYQGVLALAPISSVVIIIDVLSFSTSVEIAVNRGAIVFPYRWRDKTAQSTAQSLGAVLAQKRGAGRYSLSPASLLSLAAGTRLLLPSPNGATLSLATGTTPTLAGCLRNCQAVATTALNYGSSIAVIPAGERWTDGSLRPAVEDWLGAGAIIHYLQNSRKVGALSPQAQAAMAAYQSLQSNITNLIQHCGSGQELTTQQYQEDIAIASAINHSTCVPVLADGAYSNY